jgi:hypothetical protein
LKSLKNIKTTSFNLLVDTVQEKFMGEEHKASATFEDHPTDPDKAYQCVSQEYDDDDDIQAYVEALGRT